MWGWKPFRLCTKISAHEIECSKKIRKFPSLTFISGKDPLYVCDNLTEDFWYHLMRTCKLTDCWHTSLYWFYCQDWTLAFCLTSFPPAVEIHFSTSLRRSSVGLFLFCVTNLGEERVFNQRGSNIIQYLCHFYLQKLYLYSWTRLWFWFRDYNYHLILSRCSNDNCMDCYVFRWENTLKSIYKRHTRIHYNIKTNTFQSNLWLLALASI